MRYSSVMLVIVFLLCATLAQAQIPIPDAATDAQKEVFTKFNNDPMSLTNEDLKKLDAPWRYEIFNQMSDSDNAGVRAKLADLFQKEFGLSQRFSFEKGVTFSGKDIVAPGSLERKLNIDSLKKMDLVSDVKVLQDEFKLTFKGKGSVSVKGEPIGGSGSNSLMVGKNEFAIDPGKDSTIESAGNGEYKIKTQGNYRINGNTFDTKAATSIDLHADGSFRISGEGTFGVRGESDFKFKGTSDVLLAKDGTLDHVMIQEDKTGNSWIQTGGKKVAAIQKNVAFYTDSDLYKTDLTHNKVLWDDEKLSTAYASKDAAGKAIKPSGTYEITQYLQPTDPKAEPVPFTVRSEDGKRLVPTKDAKASAGTYDNLVAKLDSAVSQRNYLSMGKEADSETVKGLQRALSKLNPEIPIKETGVFDQQTKDAILYFQEQRIAMGDMIGSGRKGAVADAVLGPKTLAALKDELSSEDLIGASPISYGDGLNQNGVAFNAEKPTRHAAVDVEGLPIKRGLLAGVAYVNQDEIDSMREKYLDAAREETTPRNCYGAARHVTYALPAENRAVIPPGETGYFAPKTIPKYYSPLESDQAGLGAIVTFDGYDSKRGYNEDRHIAIVTAVTQTDQGPVHWITHQFGTKYYSEPLERDVVINGQRYVSMASRGNNIYDKYKFWGPSTA